MVVITGAARGIGLAAVQAFSATGWEVIGVDKDRPATEPTGATYLQLDVTEAMSVDAIRSALDRRPLHALVNNAAVSGDGPITSVDRASFDTVTNVNLRAPFELAAGLLDNVVAARGAIVNVASVHALATSANISVYAASKGGLVALTRALAVELGPQGVRCNAVVPGAIDTPMLAEGLDRSGEPGAADQRLARLVERTPLKRVGDPAEIAEAILFLADPDRSGFITGQALVVDGGATARLASE